MHLRTEVLGGFGMLDWFEGSFDGGHRDPASDALEDLAADRREYEVRRLWFYPRSSDLADESAPRDRAVHGRRRGRGRQPLRGGVAPESRWTSRGALGARAYARGSAAGCGWRQEVRLAPRRSRICIVDRSARIRQLGAGRDAQDAALDGLGRCGPGRRRALSCSGPRGDARLVQSSSGRRSV